MGSYWIYLVIYFAVMIMLISLVGVLEKKGYIYDEEENELFVACAIWPFTLVLIVPVVLIMYLFQRLFNKIIPNKK